MRGKVILVRITMSILRITPAYAGKSSATPCCYIHNQDHPRLCGEKINVEFKSGESRGSPPPMRGKVSFEIAFGSTDRITPAYAGKSNCCVVPECLLDHPRLCGEKTNSM